MERRTRRRLNPSAWILGGALATSLVTASLCAIQARASAGAERQRGVFALLDGSPKIVSTFGTMQHADPLTVTLNVRQFEPNSTQPIRRYEVEMEREIHMIVVRDDFATFAHLHPHFDSNTGTFSQVFTEAPGHRYYVYADTSPAGIGQQVFRFTLERDGAQAHFDVPTAPSAPVTRAGPYTAVLSATAFPADRPLSIDVTVLRDGHPAGDLQPYLGAPGHCVIINTVTLTYVHVHPMLRDRTMRGDMAMHEAGPLMRLQLPALPAGTYGFWLQFRGDGDRVYTAPFTVAVR